VNEPSPSTRARASASTSLSALARDPLLRFAILGALLFVVHGALARGAVGEAPIVVDGQQRAQLSALFRQRQQRAPSALETQQLVARWVEDEALFREAVRRDLVHQDPGLRDALIARMRSLLQDSTPVPIPSAAELSAYHASHRQRYLAPATTSFTEYLVPGGPRAEDTARELLRRLTRGEAVTYGAVLHSQRPVPEIRALYGEAIAEKLASLPLSTWSLLRSPRGLHLVSVEARSEATAASAEALRAQLSADWTLERQRAHFQAQLRQLVAQWPVRDGS
jgi:hypothetical protein